MRTRFERIAVVLTQVASIGRLNLTFSISRREMRRLEREGLLIIPIRKNLDNKIECFISWEEAFEGKYISDWQLWYINGKTEFFPPTKNLAERLYFISNKEIKCRKDK